MALARVVQERTGESRERPGGVHPRMLREPGAFLACDANAHARLTQRSGVWPGGRSGRNQVPQRSAGRIVSEPARPSRRRLPEGVRRLVIRWSSPDDRQTRCPDEVPDTSLPARRCQAICNSAFRADGQDELPADEVPADEVPDTSLPTPRCRPEGVRPEGVRRLVIGRLVIGRLVIGRCRTTGNCAPGVLRRPGRGQSCSRNRSPRYTVRARSDSASARGVPSSMTWPCAMR
jgi:hypothetical protein